jgi:uncharacterized membrane protein
MEIVNFLAQLWGFSLIIVALALLLRPKNLEAIFHLVKDEKMMVLVGMINAVFGIALLLTYNVWDSTWHVIISAFGWLVLTRGCAILFFPEKVEHMVAKMKSKNDWFSIILVVAILLGCFLLYKGFVG